VSKTQLWLHVLQVICRESGRLRQRQPRFPAAIVAQESAGERKWLGDDGSVHEGLNFWSILGLGLRPRQTPFWWWVELMVAPKEAVLLTAQFEEIGLAVIATYEARLDCAGCPGRVVKANLPPLA
jgi:hypothetical protein